MFWDAVKAAADWGVAKKVGYQRKKSKCDCHNSQTLHKVHIGTTKTISMFTLD